MKEILEQQRQATLDAEKKEYERKLQSERTKTAERLAIVETKLAAIPKDCLEHAYPVAKNRKFNKDELKQAMENLKATDLNKNSLLIKTYRLLGRGSKVAALDNYAVNALSLKFYLEKQSELRLARLESEYHERVAEIEKSFDEKINALSQDVVPEAEEIVEEPVEEIVPEAEEIAEESVPEVEEIVEEPIEEIVAEVEEIAEETVEEITPEAEEVAEESVEEVVAEVEEIVEEPVEEIAPEAEETVEEAVPEAEEVAEETVEEVVPEVEEIAEETVEEIVPEVEEIAEESVEDVAHEAEEVAEEFVEEVVAEAEEIAEESVAEAEEVAEEPVEEVVSEVEEIAEEPVEEIVPEVEEPVFESYTQYNGMSETGNQDATNGISLPLFLDEEGALTEFTLATSTHKNLFVATKNQNIKNAFLHTAISSIVSSYHPDDTEIWLIDYSKDILKPYLIEHTKHLRFLALENAPDFTESFLIFLNKFFGRREMMFRYANASNIEEYREKCGRYKMPRVVLIVNDFQCMARSFGENIVLRNYFETALTEYEKYGLSGIFCADTFETIYSLTETGRTMISDRFAMHLDLAEMLASIGLEEDTLDENVLLSMKNAEKNTLWYSSENSIPEKRHLLTVSEEERREMTELACNGCDTVKEDAFCFVLDGLSRREISDTELKTHITNTYNDKAVLNLCLGDPVQISIAFHTYLWKKADQNILLTGSDAENMFDILASVLRSACMQDYKTVILADAENVYFKLLKKYISAIDPQKKLVILEDKNDIAQLIGQAKGILKEEDAEMKVFLIWLGAQAYGLETSALWNGGKSGLLNLLPVQSFQDFSAIGDFDLSLFEYKISTEMAKEELLAFGYPYAQVANLALDPVHAVYYNGSKMLTFKPYRMAKEEH